MASYVQRVSDQQQVLVLADQSRFIFEEILFYNNFITKENAAQIAESIQTEKYRIQNITVDTTCIDSTDTTQKTTIVDNSVAICETDTTDGPGTKLEPSAVVRSPYSGTEVFTIFNDTLCVGNTSEITPALTFDVLDVESLSNEKFCQTYIVGK